MQTPSYFLCIDQGSQSSRASLINHDGEILAEASQTVKPLIQNNTQVEYQPEVILTSINQVIKSVLLSSQIGKKSNIIAGIATQRSTCVGWSKKTHEALSPVISWQDRRNTHWLDQFENQFNTIHKITGLLPSTHLGAGKLKWCIENIKDFKQAIFNNNLAWGPLASYLIYQLAVEKPVFTDGCNASRTLLVNLEHQRWSNTLLKLFDLPRSVLPEIKPNFYNFGTIATEGFKIPIKIVTGDQNASFFSQGLPLDHRVYITLGTGAFLQKKIVRPVKKTIPLLQSIAYHDAHSPQYMLEGTVNGCSNALNWFAKESGLQDYQNALSNALIQNTSPPLFINVFSGLGSPYFKTNLASVFIGKDQPIQKMVAIIESIVFLLVINLHEMNKISSKTTEIILGGGLSHYDGLCQRLADLSEIPVLRSNNKETTLQGLFNLLTHTQAMPESQGSTHTFLPQKNNQLKNRFVTWHKHLLTHIESHDER